MQRMLDPGERFALGTHRAHQIFCSLREVMQQSAVFTLRIDREALEELRTVAAAEHRTVSQEIRRLIHEHLTQLDRRAA
jgi:hypothetical protein